MQKNRRAVPRAKGSVLLVVMVFLLIFGALAAASVTGVNSSGRAIGNMQLREEAIAAANDALDTILSGTRFASDTALLTAEMNARMGESGVTSNLDGQGFAENLGVDVNGDGVEDLRLSMPAITFDGRTAAGPRCIRQSPVQTATLDPNNPEDRGCYPSLDAGLAGIATDDGSGNYDPRAGAQASVCANSDWMIPIRAQDAVMRTTVDVMQGVSVRVRRSVLTNCS